MWQVSLLATGGEAMATPLPDEPDVIIQQPTQLLSFVHLLTHLEAMFRSL